MMSDRKSICETEVGSRVRMLREARHESQEKLAQMIYVSREMISKIESGGQYPSVVVLARLSEHYHVSADYILFGNSPKQDVVQQLERIIIAIRAIQRQF